MFQHLGVSFDALSKLLHSTVGAANLANAGVILAVCSILAKPGATVAVLAAADGNNFVNARSVLEDIALGAAYLSPTQAPYLKGFS